MSSTIEDYRKSWLGNIIGSTISFLIGGGALGLGIGMAWIVQILPPILEERFDIQFDPQATFGVLNATWIMFLFGVIMIVIGCVEVYKAYNAIEHITKPRPEAIHKVERKFFCRYCGKENKPDAVYCEGCGKKL